MDIHGPFDLFDIRMASVVFIGIFLDFFYLLFFHMSDSVRTDSFVERVQNIRIHVWNTSPKSEKQHIFHPDTGINTI